jgi:hypothetical protein
MRYIVPLVLCYVFLSSNIATAQTWQPIAPMLEARMEFRAIKLNDGKILVAGGEGAWDGCELYDPARDKWTRTGSLNEPRRAYEMQKLPDGKVIIMGGLSPGIQSLSSCEIYDPATGNWRYTVPMMNGRHLHGSVVMPDGKIIVTGGMEVGGSIFLQECEEFDPVLETWTSLPPMPIGCYANAPHYSISENKLYVCSGVIGGYGGAYTQDVQIFDFETQRWTAGSPLTVGHADGELQSGITLNDSYILFAGRDAPSTTTNIVEYFDQPMQTWKTVGSLSASHWQGMAFPIGADTFIVLGGVEDPGPYQQTLSAASWFSFRDQAAWAGSPMIDRRYRFGGLVLSLPYDDPCREVKTIYVFGGGTPDITNHCEKLVLGPRAISNVVDVAPVRVILSHSICAQGADTVLSAHVGGCDPVSLDSIQVLVSDGHLTGPVLPLLLGANDTARISVHIESPDGERVPVRLVFSTPLGPIERFVYMTLNGGSAGKLALNASATTPRSICTSKIDSVLVRNSTCDSATIESITFTGPDAAHFTANGEGTGVAPDHEATAFYTLDAADARTYNATMVVVTNSRGHRDTLRQAITVTATGGNAVVGRTVMTDRRVRSGDTVQVPLKLVTTAKSQALGAEIDLDFNTDLLELLPPDFSGTLTDGGKDYDINVTSHGAKLYLPGTVRIDNGTIVNLRFRTFVTKASCTTVRLSTLLFSPDDPKFTACVLSTNLDSATICLDPQCGDNEIRDLLNGKSPRISVSQSTGIVTLTLTGWKSPDVKMYDELGNQVGISLRWHGSQASFDVGSTPEGAYYFRVSEAGFVRTARIAIIH